jgi:uncharacterized protein YbcC (UPF0753/DUF2309 family)
MFIRNQDFSPDFLELVDAAEHAVRKIAPHFPLSEAIAVNPFAGLSGESIDVAAARLERSAGVHIFPSRAAQLDRLEKGEITLNDIRISRLEIAPTLDLRDQAVLETVKTSDCIPRAIPTVADLAAEHSGTGWPALVTERFGAWAQCHFDTGEALWAQAAEQCAWTGWRDWTMSDLTPEIFDLTSFCETISNTKRDHWRAIEEACVALGIDRDAATSVFHRLLCDLDGWAGLARYPLSEAERAQLCGTTLSELLAIRLVWEQALHARYAVEVGPQWDALIAKQKEPLQAQMDHLISAILQRAAERASARRLDTLLQQAGEPADTVEPKSCDAQLVFCMDVRSERLRRALEIVNPSVQTYGVAGFLGLPFVHQPFDAENREVGCPELPAPTLRIKQDGAYPEAPSIRGRLVRAIFRFSCAAVSSFTYVKAVGLLKLAPLIESSQFHDRRVIGYGTVPRLALAPSNEAAADVAQAALRAIGLTENFGPVVVFAGHEASVTNDAQNDLLQCGACGGHDGAMNARALACLLNETPLRKSLARRGIEIPQQTMFQAALHDTTGDTVTFFVTDPVGDRKPQPTRWLHDVLGQACDIVRAERSTDLPATPRSGALYARDGDWSQTRPEWGLAGCHWFVAAPRNATRNRDFAGKVFLHDYDLACDPEGKFLAELVAGPLLVAAWTNLQYYGATVSSQNFGSGNKLVQNVCGGIGVLDRISGRPRGGPSDRSLFLNRKPIHDALRLIARIAAPGAAIDAAINSSPEVANLVRSRWLEVASFGQK